MTPTAHQRHAARRAERQRMATPGARISFMREAKGWSQEVLADRVHVTQPAVSQWENDHTIPARPVQFSLADLFGCTRSWLMCEEVA